MCKTLEHRALTSLVNIFLLNSSEDINRQLPVESKRYQTMERMWKKIMNNAFSNPQVISTCADQRLLENLKECNKLLEQV